MFHYPSYVFRSSTNYGTEIKRQHIQHMEHRRNAAYRLESKSFPMKPLDLCHM
jgi:hypothetical protein